MSPRLLSCAVHNYCVYTYVLWYSPFCGLLPHILACTEHKSIVYKGHFLFYNVNVALPNICKVYLQSIFVTNISQEYSIKKHLFFHIYA